MDDNISWENLILHHSIEPQFKSRTCCIFNNQSRCPNEPDKRCACYRMIRCHSFTGNCLASKAATKGDTAWQPAPEFLDLTQSTKVPVNVFGTLKPTGCKFLRIDTRLPLNNLFELIVEDCGKQKPALILSVYGGAKYFTMAERLKKEFIKGVIDAATMADAWILTAAINNGVSKLVGEGISHHRLLGGYPNKVKCIGMTMWGTINEDTRLELKNASRTQPKPIGERQVPVSVQQDRETIDLNHTHCILFDSGRTNDYLSDKHRSLFVTEACKDKSDNHTCYAITIIVEGGLGTLEVLENDIKEERPIVLIQGSGRLADVLAALVEQTSNLEQNEYWIPSEREIKQAFNRFYSNIPNAEVPLTKKRIQKILKEEHRHLLHVFCLDRDENVAETIFKAIFTAQNKKRQVDNDKKEKITSEIKEQHRKNEEQRQKNEEQRRQDEQQGRQDEEQRRKNEEQRRQDEQQGRQDGEQRRKNEEQRRKDEEQRRNDEDKLVDLALEWNYFDGVLPIFRARQGETVKKKQELDFTKADIDRQKELFQRSLEKNRSIFVEYFLSAGFDPLTLAENEDVYSYQTLILKLYSTSFTAMNTSHKNRVTNLFGTVPFHSINQIDYQLNKLIGSFFGSIYSFKDDSVKNRVKIDLTNHIFTCCGTYEGAKNDYNPKHIQNNNNNRIENKYTKQHILRDLFLWSIFMDMPDMTKVLLLHVRPRICAALIASALFKKYSKLSPTVDMKDKFQLQALEFETYAAMSLDKCYEYNEKRACELLLRQIPLFGNITCIQVAISTESVKLLQTACFDQTLNQVWFDKLSLTNQQPSAKLAQIPSILTVGILAPWIIRYRKEEEELLNDTKDEALSAEGINYYQNLANKEEIDWKTYRTRFLHFHHSPMTKMSYHFITYIFFLLVFSYMMLYHLDGRNTFDIPHWTEIYVIITVCTMFCEEIRTLHLEYDRRMVERWGSTGSTIVTVLSNVFYITPYFMFYLGLGFRYGSYNEGLLSTARIIWALDLELWYLRSLKFVIALKFLGPKLFMLKNMLRDLFAFVYMIFIAIAAYGVVSRSLILYKQVPFTGRGIFMDIFYAPYWFIHGEISDKDLLDRLIDNDNGTIVAEATATHVLLAFHMLFINILLLNLLIAVFANSISKVQENTEFYWRYQRYSFVREYFERLPLSYPPLIIIPHFLLFILLIQRKCCAKLCRNQVDGGNYVPISKRITPIFKMIPTNNSQNEQWDSFENAATHSYARSVLEKNRNKDKLSIHDEKPRRAENTNKSNVPETTDDQKEISKEELMSQFKTILTDSHKGLEQNNSELRSRLDQMNTSLEWVMNAITRVKMNDPKEPRPTSHSSSNRPTTVTTNPT